MFFIEKYYYKSLSEARETRTLRAIAFIAYAAIKICSGDAAKVNPAIWVISVLSLISFAVA